MFEMADSVTILWRETVSEQSSMLHGPEHRQAVGGVVLAASGMEAALATILSRLWDPPEQALREIAGQPAGWQRGKLRSLVDRKIPGLLRRELLGWLDDVE